MIVPQIPENENENEMNRNNQNNIHIMDNSNLLSIIQNPLYTEDKLYKFYINDNEKNILTYNFTDNKINTTKYNLITFIPKALLIQFVRLANIYFLICAILQCIPIISPLTPAIAVVPLVIVLSVSIIREGIEDYSRAKLDRR